MLPRESTCGAAAGIEGAEGQRIAIVTRIRRYRNRIGAGDFQNRNVIVVLRRPVESPKSARINGDSVNSNIFGNKVQYAAMGTYQRLSVLAQLDLLETANSGDSRVDLTRSFIRGLECPDFYH